MLVDVEGRLVIEQAVEHVGCLAFSRTDRQDAEITILIGEMAIELGAGLAAVVQVDVGALGPLSSLKCSGLCGSAVF
jgi:hypothetical protein